MTTNVLALFLFFSFGELWPTRASAEALCAAILSEGNQKIIARNLAIIKIDRDSFRQWLRWEQTANSSSMVQDTDLAEMPVSRVPTESILVDKVAELPREFFSYFVTGSESKWFHHPFNEESSVAFFSDPIFDTSKVNLTASRSVVPYGHRFSIKMATDHPNPNRGSQKDKANGMVEEANDSRRMSDYILAMERKIGLPVHSRIMKDVLAIKVLSPVEGAYIVRDLRPIVNSEYYYFPAAGIPSEIGHEIAHLNGESFGGFWSRVYAQAVGKAEAELLIRHFVKMGSLHSQNIKIEFDKEMRPTGRLVFIDVGDWFAIKQLIVPLGYSSIAMDLNYLRDLRFFRIDIGQLMGFFDDLPNGKIKLLIENDVIESWRQDYETSFRQQIVDMLKPNLANEFTNGRRSDQVRDFLLSEEGLILLRNFHKQATNLQTLLGGVQIEQSQ